MPSRYDAATRAKAVRLVTEHGGDYGSEWEAISTVAGRWGMSSETLRKWLRQAEVDAGDGVTMAAAREIRELRRKNAELEQTVEILKARPRLSSCGRATRDAGDLCVHRRAEGSVRGRFDLPRADRARLCDRPENLLRSGGSAAVEASLVGRHDHRGHGRLFVQELPARPAVRCRVAALVEVHGHRLGKPGPRCRGAPRGQGRGARRRSSPSRHPVRAARWAATPLAAAPCAGWFHRPA
jgi:transposase